MKKSLFALLVTCLFFCLFSTYSLAEEYVVQPRENATIIAEKVDMEVGDFLKVNNLKKKDIIKPGQKLLYISQKERLEAIVWWNKRGDTLEKEAPVDFLLELRSFTEEVESGRRPGNLLLFTTQKTALFRQVCPPAPLAKEGQ